ncbi:MAG: phage tail assembly protein [Gammaproteobacteria bacterium]|nr:phage tail assembly protein [Gammaproteobacteria bacterium]MDH5651692.1 phage tail assembly protein [Gammaproteobacteria bacterium]
MKTIVLEYPVTVNGQEYSELNMRRPKVRDQKAASVKGKTDAEREISLFANLCEVEPALIEELDMTDYTAIQETYQDFLSRGQR